MGETPKIGVMATGIRKATLSVATTKRSNLGRGSGMLVEISHYDDKSEESTPLTNPGREVEFSTNLGCLEGKRKKDVQKSRKVSTTKVATSTRRAPEDRIKLFAFRLAFLEKTASQVGTITFLWATVVLLGGFATSLTYSHFWVVAVIIFADALRIFNRSYELEWQMILRWPKEGEKLTGTTYREPRQILSSRRNISFISKSILILNQLLKPWVMSGIPYILQLVSAVLCVGLSIWRLSVQEFCVPDEKGASICKLYRENVVVSMNLFYSMAVLEATLFLVEKGYFEYRMRYRELLSSVKEDLFEGKLDLTVFEKFYFTVYQMSLKGSIFDGLDMSLVAFAIRWLQSDDFEQQLHGAKLLNGFVSAKGEDNSEPDPQTADALRRLGTTPGIIERLVEMLSWNAEHEVELVGEIAAIVCGLVGYDHNWSRFVAVPGALDAVVSLFRPQAEHFSLGGKDSSMALPKVLDFRVKALKILKYLCKSHITSLEIGETRGLVPLLTLFIQGQGRSAKGNMAEHEISLKVFKKSLKVLHYLAANGGTSGRTLRQHVAGVVSVLKNLRDVIKDRDEEPYLQLLSIKILYDLALEDNVRYSIGATGGIIRLLFSYFRESNTVHREAEKIHASNETKSEDPEKDWKLKHEQRDRRDRRDRMDRMEWSGKVLSRLMLQNKDNCLTLLALKDKDGKKPLVRVMVAALGREGEVAASAAKILRSVLKYADESTRMEITELSAPVVLPNISPLADTKSGLYEACLGLAARAMESLRLAKYRETPSSRTEFVKRLIKNLKHSPTTTKVPQIRRYSLEVIIAVFERDEYLEYFQDVFAGLSLKEELEKTSESISDVENFILLSGLLGYSRHSEDIKSLVLRCIAAVDYRLSP